jgi:hypothetical protein
MKRLFEITDKKKAKAQLTLFEDGNRVRKVRSDKGVKRGPRKPKVEVKKPRKTRSDRKTIGDLTIAEYTKLTQKIYRNEQIKIMRKTNISFSIPREGK